MAPKLSNIERETIILFNDAEESAEVCVYQKAMQRKLAQLAGERPDECQRKPDSHYEAQGAMVFMIPKVWVKIRPTLLLSEEERERRSMAGKRKMAENLR